MNDDEVLALCQEWNEKRPFAEEDVTTIVDATVRLIAEVKRLRRELALYLDEE